MEFIPAAEITALSNPGVISRQLLNPENSRSQRVTVTEVHLEPGASQPRHVHQSAEQIWYALTGSGRLLLAEGQEQPFRVGDVARFVDGDVHGLVNDGEAEFVYLSVTAPPIHFGYAYQERQSTEKRREP
jgi:quercetin dioxygenase-like cupin family protein